MIGKIKNKIKYVISFLRGLIQKQEITENDLHSYIRKTIERILYVSKQHLINRKRVIRRKTRVIIKHYNMKYKAWPKRKIDKIPQWRIADLMNWSSRVVLYQKQRLRLAKSNRIDSNELHEPKVNESQLQSQKKETESKKSNSLSDEMKLLQNKATNVELNAINKISDKIELLKRTQQQLDDKNDEKKLDLPSQDNISAEKAVNFLDYLIKKLNEPDSSESKCYRPSAKGKTVQQCDPASSKPTNARVLNLNRKRPRDEDPTTSDNSSDFLGFDETEMQTVAQSENSVFVSEKLNSFLRENALENATDIDLPKFQKFDEGLVCDGASPPPIKIGKIVNNFGKAPRTVAEKRMLLGKKNRLKYFIIENGNTVYREFKKCTESGQCNRQLIEILQSMDVPMTRDTWIAAAWLRTEKEKYFFQTVNIDGKLYKLRGSQGNHTSKLLGVWNKSRLIRHSKAKCPSTCTQKSIITGVRFRKTSLKNITDIGVILEDKKNRLWNYFKTDETYKPGPLSRKRFLDEDKKDVDLAVYEMPTMQLEVHPELNRPLDEKIRPYLKLVLPSSRISREWAEFSVSTLITKCTSANQRKSFTFNIPYLNNQTTILVRKLCMRNECSDATQLEFTKNVDRNNEVEATCADVLTEMIDSVALGFSENSMIKDDPDIDYNQNKVRCNNDARSLSQSKEEVTKSVATANSEKTIDPDSEAYKRRRLLLKELKQLNATIVETDDIRRTGDIKCNNEHCRLGCVCPSPFSLSTLTNHCSRIECMLKCECDKNADLIHTNESALLIREKATARLAKVEKEFCATLVLTNDSTYLVNESHGERRRSKRAPKRFEDYVHENNLHQTADADADDKPLESHSGQDNDSEISTITLKEHCNVVLDRLPSMENVEPWCMVHGLYKCFCNLDAVEGEPFKLDADEEVSEESEVVYRKKPQYSFEKGEDSKKSIEISRPPPASNIRSKYYSSAYIYGSRCAKIPTMIYRNRNSRRAYSVKKQAELDNTSTKLAILNRHIANMAYSDVSSSKIFLPKTEHVIEDVLDVPPTTDTQEIPIPVSAGFSYQNDDWLFQGQDLLNTRAADINATTSMVRKIKTEPSSDSEYTSETTGHELADMVQPKLEPSKPSMPVITSVVSLHPNSESHRPKIQPSIRHFLSTAVGKSISSIRNLLSQNSTRIFDPIPKTLHSMEWKSFMEAYVTDKMYVWEISINSKNILVATTKNMIPLIPGAMKAVNIKISTSGDELPLLGKMLRSQMCCEKTQSLSVFLAGQNGYWLIIGFHNKTDIKPTATTHPEIYAKLHRLYTIFLHTQMRLSGKSQGNDTSHGLVPLSQASTRNDVVHDSSGNEDSRTSEDASESTDSKVFAVSSDFDIASTSNTYPNAPLPTHSAHSKKSVMKATTSDFDRAPETSTESSKTIPVPGFHKYLSSSNIVVTDLPIGLEHSIVIPVSSKSNAQVLYWHMVVMGDDCSHIYVPYWKDFLTKPRIKKSAELASSTKKSVMLGAVSANAAIYVTYTSDKTFYIGPYIQNIPLNLLACQMHNGKILLREDFAKKHHIEYKRKTIAYWLQLKDSHLILPTRVENNTKPKSSTIQTAHVPMKRPSTEPGQSLLKSKVLKTQIRQFPFGLESDPSTEDASDVTHETQASPRDTTSSPHRDRSRMSILYKQKSALGKSATKLQSSPTPGNGSQLVNKVEQAKPIKPLPPVCIAGFFITDAVELGKIPAAKKGSSTYEIRSLSTRHWRRFYTENQVNNFLMMKLSQQARTAYSSRNLQWRFVSSDSGDSERYPFRDFTLMSSYVVPKQTSTITNVKTHARTMTEDIMSSSVINCGQFKATSAPLNGTNMRANDVIVIDDD